MNYTLFANKLGMSSYIDQDGNVFPVTLISLLNQEPLFFQKTKTNGYNAVVVGYSDISEKNLNNPIIKNMWGLIDEFEISVKIIEDLLDGIRSDIKAKVKLNSKIMISGT